MQCVAVFVHFESRSPSVRVWTHSTHQIDLHYALAKLSVTHAGALDSVIGVPVRDRLYSHMFERRFFFRFIDRECAYQANQPDNSRAHATYKQNAHKHNAHNITNAIRAANSKSMAIFL